MPYNPKIHHRRSIRLKGYDYTQPGAYWVTLTAHERQSLFGEIIGNVMQLNALGKLTESLWSRLPAHFSLRHDEWVIMPNHLHAIVFILGVEGRGEAFANEIHESSELMRQMLHPNQSGPIGTAPGSLGAIIQNFKSVSARKINQARGTPGAAVWQRDYYERVVRDEAELAQFRRYIRENPERWLDDEERLSTG